MMIYERKYILYLYQNISVLFVTNTILIKLLNSIENNDFGSILQVNKDYKRYKRKANYR